MQIGTIPERLSALATGKVQAAMLNSPDNFRAEKSGYYNLVTVRIPYQGVGVATTYTAYTSPNNMFTTVKELSFKVSKAHMLAPYGLLAFEIGGDESGQADGGHNDTP